MRTKKLGVIGGMGSEATSYFFEEVIGHTVTDSDQDHIDMVILNHASLPDRTEAILSKEEDEIVEKLVQDAQTLEEMGVKHIAIPCNTSHYFYDRVQKSVSIPIIHMIRESIRIATKKYKAKKIGIMGTTGTIKSKIYQKEAEKQNIETMIPSKERQEDVMSLIYDDIKKGSTGDTSKFHRVYDDLTKKGSEVIILACTELSVFKKKHTVPKNCLDAMDVLVKEAIERSDAIYQ